MISALVALGTIVLLGIPAAVIFIPVTLISGDIMPLYHAGIFITRLALRMAGVRVVLEGRERVPANTACIFMANHLSNLDPPVLLPLIPGRTSAFLKSSLMRIPVLGYAMKLGEFVPVERTGHVDSARQSVRTAQAVLRKGIHITTFVEGTRSSDGRLLPFKKGPFYLAMHSGAACIPVSIYGTESLMPKGSLRIRRGTAHMVFHAPIQPADYHTREKLMQAVREAINSGLPERMKG